MKSKPTSILLIAISCFILFACQQEQGFTNKAEAKNLMVNGLKEGKWMEYFNDIGKVATDTIYFKADSATLIDSMGNPHRILAPWYYRLTI